MKAQKVGARWGGRGGVGSIWGLKENIFRRTATRGTKRKSDRDTEREIER